MNMPRATMRLQFNRDFTFAHAAALVPYLASLGVSHLYASPIMTARPGSPHGYDTIDATRVNPELGGEGELRRLVGKLRRHELGLIVDIVPNHMAIGSGNAWWMDVLARGRDSRFAKYFDIDWSPADPQLRGKVLLPILGRPYGEALAAGEITLRGGAGQRPVVRYFDQEFPLNAECARSVDTAALADIAASETAGCERLHDILERQHYRLAWWRCANDQINWRRFFDINELAALRVEDEEVFEAVHAMLFRLYAEGLLDGVRVDHVDGLSRPGQYCRQLRARLSALDKHRPVGCPPGPAYFVVEKILAHNEELPATWQTDGTTGYDFMDEVSALQHDNAGQQALTELWQRISGRAGFFKTEEEQSRRDVLRRSFSSQLEATIDVLFQIAQGGLGTRDISRAALRRGLTEILVQFPVYRIYAEVGRSSPSDRALLSRAVSRATRSCLRSDRWLIELLGRWLIGEPIRHEAQPLQGIALTRFEQLSAPLSAKAVEDTAFYRYGRLLSRNDVGFDPDRFASSAAEFHDRMQLRRSHFPHALLATATHDHKRGEDTRARLAVLSELANEWSTVLERWIAASTEQFRPADGKSLPDAADRALLFQTLVGAWPLNLTLNDQEGLAGFSRRIAAWQQKSLREAKLRTDWSTPDEDYERAAGELVAWLFAPPSALLKEIADFAGRIAAAGAVNSLSQVLIKLTAPGVPDLYQGTDYWDLSLVDPDNRAPVDFAARQQSLASPEAGAAENWRDGRLKQHVIARALAVRKVTPELFDQGEYVPLRAEGPLAPYVIAFARILRDEAAVTIVCHKPARLLQSKNSVAVAKERWEQTKLVLPDELRSNEFEDALNAKKICANRGSLEIAEIFEQVPVALLLVRGL